MESPALVEAQVEQSDVVLAARARPQWAKCSSWVSMTDLQVPKKWQLRPRRIWMVEVPMLRHPRWKKRHVERLKK